MSLLSFSLEVYTLCMLLASLLEAFTIKEALASSEKLSKTIVTLVLSCWRHIQEQLIVLYVYS